MNKKTIIGMVISAACLAAPAHAGFYLGGGVTLSKPDYSFVDDATGAKIFAGYRFEGTPILLEASYFDSGDADVDWPAGATVGFKGFQASVGYSPVLSSTGSTVWVKGGFYSGDVTADAPGSGGGGGGTGPMASGTVAKAAHGTLADGLPASGELEESSSGAVLGIGGVWKLTHWFGLRAEVENFFGLEDFMDDEDLLVYSAGLVFEFPVARSAP